MDYRAKKNRLWFEIPNQRRLYVSAQKLTMFCLFETSYTLSIFSKILFSKLTIVHVGIEPILIH